jgi:hypothetical protein
VARASEKLTGHLGLKDKGTCGREGGHSACPTASDLWWKANVRLSTSSDLSNRSPFSHLVNAIWLDGKEKKKKKS